MLIPIHYFRARTTQDKIVDLALRNINMRERFIVRRSKSQTMMLPAIPGFSNQLRTTRTQAQ